MSIGKYKARLFGVVLSIALLAVTMPRGVAGQAPNFVIYNIYQALNMGNADEILQKDYYVSMGSSQGVHQGSILQVMRRVPTFDMISQQLYSDVTFPIALVKVIHVEESASIARLEKMLPAQETPAITPRAIMLGDVVRIPDLSVR